MQRKPSGEDLKQLVKNVDVGADEYLKRRKVQVLDKYVKNFLLTLPVELLVPNIIFRLELENFLKLFRLSREFSEFLTKDVNIWKMLFIHYFGQEKYNEYKEYVLGDVTWRNMFFAVNLVEGTFLQTNILTVNFRKELVPTRHPPVGEFYNVKMKISTRRGEFKTDIQYNLYMDNMELFNMITLATLLIFGTNIDMRSGARLMFKTKGMSQEAVIRLWAVLVANIFAIGFRSNINPDTFDMTDKYVIGSMCVYCTKNEATMKCCSKGLYCSRLCQERDTLH